MIELVDCCKDKDTEVHKSALFGPGAPWWTRTSKEYAPDDLSGPERIKTSTRAQCRLGGAGNIGGKEAAPAVEVLLDALPRPGQ